jgi:hypothetical protein
VLAVATGRTDAQALADAGAHRVVGSLEDTGELTRWLLGADFRVYWKTWKTPPPAGPTPRRTG